DRIQHGDDHGARKPWTVEIRWLWLRRIMAVEAVLAEKGSQVARRISTGIRRSGVELARGRDRKATQRRAHRCLDGPLVLERCKHRGVVPGGILPREHVVGDMPCHAPEKLGSPDGKVGKPLRGQRRFPDEVRAVLSVERAVACPAVFGDEMKAANGRWKAGEELHPIV